MFGLSKFLIRVIGWLMLGVLLNGFVPFRGDTSIGEHWYGPGGWDEVIARLTLWMILGVGILFLNWVLRMMPGKSGSKGRA